ncbi:MAG: hypothetical protein ACFFDO_03455 [Candidatus Thorarchaeota archaeon]
MSEIEENRKVDFANEVMNEEGLKGKPTLNKILKIIDNVGYDKERVKETFLKVKAKEDFANEVMGEMGIKGKAKRIEILRIIDTVGNDKRKIKTALLRASIADKIHHD